MVRKTRERTVTEDVEAHEEFEEHTKVGNIDELVARTRKTEPAATSANVIRRGSSPVMAAPPRAQGSQTDVREDKRDEDAFDEYDEQPVEKAFASAQPLPLPAPSESIPIAIPNQSTMPVMRSKVRWGLIAWFALLALMIGVGTVGYVRIKQLEEQLASQTKR